MGICHDTPAFECQGFVTTFLRGTEWAATGVVTRRLPEHGRNNERPSMKKLELKEGEGFSG